jgi:dihydroxyacetone kinase-like predicted kinase
MVSINEELRAAKAAKAAINSLSTTPLSKSVFLATLNRANHTAILNLSSGGALNEARGNIGIVLSNLMFGPRTPEKIDKAKSAIEAWIRELEASPAA